MSVPVDQRTGFLPFTGFLARFSAGHFRRHRLEALLCLIGVALVVKSVAGRGPTITLSFISAEGLETGKTKLKYKEVDVGTVKNITLSKDHSRVLVDVQLTKVAEDFAVKDTRFWVVRPRVAASGVTGLGTLLSGAYIGVDAGRSKEDETHFVGLESPPAVTGDVDPLGRVPR